MLSTVSSTFGLRAPAAASRAFAFGKSRVV